MAPSFGTWGVAVGSNGSSAGNGVAAGAVDVDVVVVGAGFAGLYLLHRLRGLGFSAVVIESADDVGGTWYWNRYPGARCDIQSLDYSYSFDRELDETWTWTEKYAPQPEILRYAQHVADKHDLRRDIRFSTRVESAAWDDALATWRVRTSAGDEIACRFYVMATGCLSMPKEVDIEGTGRFEGDAYSTSRWPHEGVDLTGKRVAVIGTGSSGIQSIPLIAAEAAQLTVFQRTPNFSMPANNGPVPAGKREAVERDRAAYREAARWSRAGVPVDVSHTSALAVSDEERLARYEEMWATGGIIELIGCYSDHLLNPQANELLCEFVRDKIRATVHDPVTAEALCPTTYPIGTKRLCVDTDYYATFNLPHVRLVDLRTHPIATITETGIDLVDESLGFDVIVFATGFDAMTGAIVGVDIAGRDGITLKDAWRDGPTTYLGLMAAGFPNLFMITGPGSPSVLSNMMVSIEQHVDWIADCLEHLRTEDLVSIEPTDAAVAGWVRHVNDFADITLMPHANSWYMGANVRGKPRVFLPYVGGVDAYRRACDEVVAGDYLGFERRGPAESRRTDGVIRRVQPDVAMMLELVAGLGLPVLDSLSPVEARAFSEMLATQRPPGPDVGEVVDGTLPGPEGELAYRLYRPATAGPHPVIVYFHGGGWVLGHATSDDPFCRDLCNRAGAVVVSVDYRHAPEARFPAAVEDAFAAMCWVAEHAGELGGDGDRLAVAGWSAGANLAAVVCQLARDAGGPRLAAQLLVTPVTDADFTRPSYVENAEGFILTASLMRWFWDHYTDSEDRSDPRVSPLRAGRLEDLPPAVLITAELDPLRDEGAAYANALAAAGVPVQHVAAVGHTHTSVLAVDLLPSGAPVRVRLTDAARELLGVPVPA
jgi:cation diffusion facilitator CzcD-associated flavoprotein CzcO/acetyl esterase/lipase